MDLYRQTIKQLILALSPIDSIEAGHLKETLEWIDSGSPLCREQKPATPPKHLVSYFTLFDPSKQLILLVDHKKALLWLPPGGHVEPGEHPNDTARRELNEELGINLPLFNSQPIFLSVTETVGKTPGHIDISLWYLFVCDSSEDLVYDRSEFNAIKWFPLNKLPLKRTDPHLLRFCQKLNTILTMSNL